MRKPRDYDAELKALTDKAKLLQERKLRQLGELVVAAGADALPIEQLAGALLSICDAPDMVRKEEWRARGATFFRKRRQRAGGGAAARDSRSAQDRRHTPPAAGGDAA